LRSCTWIPVEAKIAMNVQRASPRDDMDTSHSTFLEPSHERVGTMPTNA
jgi:hypothetical protein